MVILLLAALLFGVDQLRLTVNVSQKYYSETKSNIYSSTNRTTKQMKARYISGGPAEFNRPKISNCQNQTDEPAHTALETLDWLLHPDVGESR